MVFECNGSIITLNKATLKRMILTHWGRVTNIRVSKLTIIGSDNSLSPVAPFTKDVNPRLAKRPLVFNGRLANRGLTSLVKEAAGRPHVIIWTGPGILLIGPLWTNLMKFKSTFIYLHSRNAFDNVFRKLAAILPRPQSAKLKHIMKRNIFVLSAEEIQDQHDVWFFNNALIGIITNRAILIPYYIFNQSCNLSTSVPLFWNI